MDTAIQAQNQSATIQTLLEQINNLLATPALNAKYQAKDLLDRIDEYDWSPKNGVDVEYYEDLVETGKEGYLTDAQFIELVDLTDPDAYPPHTYFVILTARQKTAMLAVLTK